VQRPVCQRLDHLELAKSDITVTDRKLYQRFLKQLSSKQFVQELGLMSA
jgi:hypothetical protein